MLSALAREDNGKRFCLLGLIISSTRIGDGVSQCRRWMRAEMKPMRHICDELSVGMEPWSHRRGRDS